ncbi:MAG: carbohydrate ABC transporter permease, partial [candidate division Zixibacteria bacterium]
MVGSVSITGRIIRYMLLTLLALIMIAPLLWMFRVSFTDPGSALTLDRLGGDNWTLANFVDLFSVGNMGRYLFNSMIVAVVVTIGNILFCVMTGWILARKRGLGNRLLFGSVVAVLMIPAHIVIIPLYRICITTGIYDSYWALILPWLVSPIGIFLARQYIETIPPSMEEAARVDGASEWRILMRIILPMCRPAVAVLAV